MKESRKLLREALKDIRRDMTDEEVLNLLQTAKFPKTPQVRRKNTPSASGRRMPLPNLRAAGRSSSPSPAC